MDHDDKKVAFIKVLVAAAWADGELNPQEIRTLTEYLRRLGISPAEYAELKPLLDGPLRPAEAHLLLEQQLEWLSSRPEQGAVLAAVEDLLLADDKLSEAEGDFLSRLRELMKNPATPQLFVSQLRGLWRDVAAPAALPSRQRGKGESGEGGEQTEPSEEFYRRRLLEYFRHTLALARARASMSMDSGVPDADLYRVVIWAALLSVVAHADADFCPAEEAELLELLRVDEQLPEPDLKVVVDAYRSASLEQFDLAWLVREFSKIASPEEAGRLLDCLFLVAAADGELHQHELAVIREIATRLGFADDVYQAGLSRCESRMQRGWN